MVNATGRASGAKATSTAKQTIHPNGDPAPHHSTAASRDIEDVLDIARRIATTVVRHEAPHSDQEAAWPAASFAAVQERGLAGLVVPRDAEGLGLGLHGMARVCETFGRESASFAISFGMHCVGSAVIAAKATDAQRDALLLPIARGQHITTLALSEPGTGAHFYYPQARMRRVAPDASPARPENGHEHGSNGNDHSDDDGVADPPAYVLNGTKSFVTNGSHADSYVISANTGTTAPEPGLFSCVIVPGGTPGIEWGDPFRGLGMRGNSSRTVRLVDVALPADALLGGEGDQLWYVFNVVAPYFLVAMAGTYLGVASRALDAAIEHVGARDYEHDGSRLAEAPIMQHRIGELWAKVARTRSLVYWAAREADAGGPDALPALCAAKAEVADCAVNVVNEAMTIMGGKTYRDGTLLSRLLRDARAAHVMAPTTDLLRMWTGRSLLQIPILGD